VNATTHRTGAGTATTLVLVAAAVSAGVHAGLAPHHLHEWPPLGAAFVAAAAAVAAAVAALVLQPQAYWPARVLSALLGSLVVAYVLTRLGPLPPLDPEREPVDALGVFTSAVEAAGSLVATGLGWPRPQARQQLPVTTGGTA
jgi:CHASE2 domain-containing sensor protein